MLRIACLALSGALLATSGQPDASRIRFVDRAPQAGITITTISGSPDRNYILETLGTGAAMLDYDGDGDTDIYVVNGSRLEPTPPGEESTGALYRNDGKDRFTDVTREAGLSSSFWGFGAAVGDYDNDGDPDLYVTAWGPNRLFRNDGDGTFTEVAADTGVDDSRFSTSAAFLDYDGDGTLDLYVANYVTFDPATIPRKGDPDSPCTFRGLTVMCGPHGLPGALDALYHNNGDGTFTDVSRQAGLLSEGGLYGLGVTTSDIDGDGLVDILVANDSTANHLYRNLGDGRFVDDAVMSGFAYSNDGREQAGMGIDAADIDGDLDPDVFITNFSHDYCTLRINDGNGFLEDVSVRVGLVEPTVRSLGWGTLLLDMDNDGDRDIFIANGHVYPEVERADIGTTYRQRNQYFENLGDLKFREVPAESAEDGSGRADLHRGVAAGDIDGDGDLDLLVTVIDGSPELLINESKGGSWLKIRLVGRLSNRDGVGARVTVRAGSRSWMAERRGGGSFLSASDAPLHFGLGSARAIDVVDIAWPSGVLQRVKRPPIGALLTIEESGPSARGASDAVGAESP